MFNSCSFSIPPKFLVCEFPLCNCNKCMQLRCDDKTDQNVLESSETKNAFDIDKCLIEAAASSTANSREKSFPNQNDDQLLDGNLPGRRNISMISSNLESVLLDIVGITAFIIMATAIFWLTVSKNLFHFIKLTFQSGRQARLTALFLLLLLCASITFHAIKGKNRIKHTDQNFSKSNDMLSSQNSAVNDSFYKCQQKCCYRRKCSATNSKGSCKCVLNTNGNNKFNLKRNEPSLIGTKNQSISLCDLCAKVLKNNSKSEYLHMLTDEEAHKMYRKFKLYSIPTEMKSPPSFGSLIEFLSSLYNYILDSRIFHF